MTACIRISSYTLVLLCLIFMTGCSTPIGVTRVTARQAYLDNNTNPLNSGELSNQAKYVLNRYDLLKTFAEAPEPALARLHEKALRDDRRDVLYALAEGCYLHAGKLANHYSPEERERAPDFFLMAALYAYYFTLETPHASELYSETVLRNAMNIYNYGLWQGFEVTSSDALDLNLRERVLPFGAIAITRDATRFPWQLEDFDGFVPSDKYMVRGVTVRNRTQGVGLPLIGINRENKQYLPVTAFLRIKSNLADVSSGAGSATLEFYSALDSSSVVVNDRTVPLETDITTPLAYRFEGSKIFDLGLLAFLGKEPNKLPDGLYMTEPYRPGKIPVVFIHGTASIPVWWLEMFNTLRFDPQIREKYQFWYYVYTSNKPVADSAADLRDALIEKVALLEQKQQDPVLRKMVVVGHSQGGLLTKFLVVDTGQKLVMAMTGKDIDSLNGSEKSKTKLRRILVIKPLPFVKNVIFLSTPHRGSYQSKEWNRSLVRWLITLPKNIIDDSLEYYDYLSDDVKKMVGGRRTYFTSADGMSPDNPLIRTLAEIPLAEGVEGHSIISVSSDGDPKLGNDGVVEYQSAHLEGMASELIVHGGHSSQLEPLAIDEVRRILVESLNTPSGQTIKPKQSAKDQTP